ncbi:MAG TPA: SRPBCC family protein [Anaerolineales bacterium]|nr:SRPBCC family protein [Anaerolineales bacterium]
MINFSLNARIYRSLKQVFSFVTTPENDFQWQYGTLASTQLSKGEVGIGTLFRTIGHFMGRRVESTYEVTEFELNKKFGFKSLSGPMHSHTLYTFEVIDGSTRMNIATQANPGDLFKTADVIVEKKVKKQYKENLAMLKDVLETRRADHT